MKSGSLCALQWRILSWCTRQQVTLRARHIPAQLNVIADKLSRLGQTIQTEWSLHPKVFQAICSRWHQPQVDLFATRFNNNLPQFVSPVPDPRPPDPQAWAVDAQEPVKSEPTCLAPRTSAIKEQGFSEAVAARIEAPQRGSTRSVYEAKWAIITKWCLSNRVDFRAPPLKAIADFLLHLFQDKKLQPGTIDGYRSAIADKLGNSTINVSKDENLTRLLDSFHRDRPKGRRGIPSWNLSLVLHQLTKAPFEPLKEASLKHRDFQDCFLAGLRFW